MALAVRDINVEYNTAFSLTTFFALPVYHEAIIAKDVELISEMYKRREVFRMMRVLKGVGATFANFASVCMMNLHWKHNNVPCCSSQVPDFYYELKWEICGCKCIQPMFNVRSL